MWWADCFEKYISPTGHTNLQELHCCQQQLNSIIDSPREENLFALHTETQTHTHTHAMYRSAPIHRQAHTNLLGHWNSCHRISCTITFVLNVQEYICPWKRATERERERVWSVCSCVCLWKRWNLTKTGKRLKLLQVWDNCLQNAVNCIIIARFWNVETSHSGISFFPLDLCSSTHTRFWKSRCGRDGAENAHRTRAQAQNVYHDRLSFDNNHTIPYVYGWLIVWLVLTKQHIKSKMTNTEKEEEEKMSMKIGAKAKNIVVVAITTATSSNEWIRQGGIEAIESEKKHRKWQRHQQPTLERMRMQIRKRRRKNTLQNKNEGGKKESYWKFPNANVLFCSDYVMAMAIRIWLNISPLLCRFHRYLFV